MPDTVSLAGVILAGGESRRMGRDKATLPFPGTAGSTAPITMVEHVVGVLGQRCEPVFVMAAQGQPLPALSVRVIRDELTGLGPLPATARGLRAAWEAGAQWAFISGVDMPLVDVELIDLLVSRAAETGADVVIPWDGRDHYLASVYRTDLVDQAEALVAAGQRAMRVLTGVADTQRIVLPAGTNALVNVNTPADLRALARR